MGGGGIVRGAGCSEPNIRTRCSEQFGQYWKPKKLNKPHLKKEQTKLDKIRHC